MCPTECGHFIQDAPQNIIETGDTCLQQPTTAYNSLQQLQAKIAALIPAVQACSGYARNGEAIRSVVEKMRQLSVVQ